MNKKNHEQFKLKTQEYSFGFGAANNQNAPVLFLIHSILGDPSVDYDAFLPALRKHNKYIRKCITIAARGLHCPLDMDETINAIANDYAKYIETHCEKSPILLLGWSTGGVIAGAIAEILQKRHEVFTIAIDIAAPKILSEELPIEHFIEKYLVRLMGYEAENFALPRYTQWQNSENYAEWKNKNFILKWKDLVYIPEHVAVHEKIIEIFKTIQKKYKSEAMTKPALVNYVFNNIIDTIEKSAVDNKQRYMKQLETMRILMMAILNYKPSNSKLSSSMLIVCQRSANELNAHLGWGNYYSKYTKPIVGNHCSIMGKSREDHLPQTITAINHFLENALTTKQDIVSEYTE